MLGAIERATRQTIKPMALPSRKDITNRRIGLFKEQIAEAMESQDMEFFEELIDQYQSEHDIGHRKIAATLAYLLQKDRPLQKEEGFAEEIPVRNERPDAQRSERGGRPIESNMQTYRIEVGRMHGVEPGNIVGAISNEGNLNSKDIGRIKLFDSFSLVDLPKTLSQDVLHKLKSVWVCEEQLQISVDSGSQKSQASRPDNRRTFGKGKPGDRSRFKPGTKKAPFGKRGAPKR